MFGYAEIQTWTGWVRIANATSVLCRPSNIKKYFGKIHKIRYIVHLVFSLWETSTGHETRWISTKKKCTTHDIRRENAQENSTLVASGVEVAIKMDLDCPGKRTGAIKLTNRKRKRD